MELDDKIFKSVFGRDYDKNDSEEEDMFATMALHYLLNSKGVPERSSNYHFRAYSRGMWDLNCMDDIRKQSADSDRSELSDKAKNVLYAIEVALELTAEEVGQRFNERDVVIEGALYNFIKTKTDERFDKDEWHSWNKQLREKAVKESFKMWRVYGDYKLAKTFSNCFEYAYEAISNQTGIIVSSKANYDNQEADM